MASTAIVAAYLLHASKQFYQHVFCHNIAWGSGKRSFKVSGVSCPKCGEWREFDVWYPTVDCSLFDDLAEEDARHIVPAFERSESFTPDAFDGFAAKLAPRLGPMRPLLPGTRFGIWTGWAVGNIGDFAWRREGQPVVRESVFRAMLDAGFAVTGAAMPYRAKRDLGEQLIHLEIPPVARIAAAAGGSICKRCGEYSPGRRTIIDAASFDRTVPIQRVREMPGTLIVTAELADFLRSRQFTDVAIERIEFQ